MHRYLQNMSGQDLCVVCLTEADRSAIFCGSCLHGCSRNVVVSRVHWNQTEFSLIWCPRQKCSADWWRTDEDGDGWWWQTWSSLRVSLPQWHVLCLEWLQADCSHRLQVCMGQVCPMTLLFPPSTICLCWPKDKCMQHVWRLWGCMNQRKGPRQQIPWTACHIMASMISQIHYINVTSIVNLNSLLTKLCTLDIDVMFSTSKMQVAC